MFELVQSFEEGMKSLVDRHRMEANCMEHLHRQHGGVVQGVGVVDLHVVPPVDNIAQFVRERIHMPGDAMF